ncbi:MAG: mechanosensitive ion channel [Bacteroidales bacterium]|nr:mechanosensitive ion channel [Bacteroidales bacterium]
MNYLFDVLAYPFFTVLLIIVLLVFNNLIFNKLSHTVSNIKLIKRSISFLILIVGILIFIFSLPVDKSIKGQIISFLAVIISAGIALSSTTLLGNLIAGVMNNSMGRFRNGDLINIDNYYGRVTHKSIFHTEIQLEDSNLITIPNLYIASNPVKLIRKNNTVVSTSVSLGYDVSREVVEKVLKDAAEKTGLKDPYVYITDLGDFSVVYKIHGFLEDSTAFFSSASRLNVNVMDGLHAHNVEIVSPTFMNQRRVDDTVFISQVSTKQDNTQEDEILPEELIFDEAMESAKLEKKKDFLLSLDKKLREYKKLLKQSKDKEEEARFELSVQRMEEVQKKIQQSIAEAHKEKE